MKFWTIQFDSMKCFDSVSDNSKLKCRGYGYINHVHDPTRFVT